MRILKKSLLLLFLTFILSFIVGCNIIIPDNGNNDLNQNLQIDIIGDNEVAIGKTILLDAQIKIENISSDVIWKSMDESIATVSSDGVVTGISEGRTTIIAKSVDDEKIIGKINIRVTAFEGYTELAPTEIILSSKTVGTVGELIVIDYQTIPQNASQNMIWNSSNEDVAKVEGRGIVTLLSPGSAEITVSSKVNTSITATITINVVERNKISDYEAARINVIEETKNSILGVASHVVNNEYKYIKAGIGSGFVYKTIKEDEQYYHYLITNKHVVEGSDKLTIYLHFIDQEIDAELLGYDDKVDLAIVGFYYEKEIKPLNFYNSDILKAGQTVIAIGNPEGFQYSSSATSGIISHPLRYVGDDTDDDGVNDWDAAYIQHDASINPGNSGGPLLNLYGDVIGINTMKLSATDIDNMGFSVPTKTICELLPYLENGDTPVRATIGVQIIAMRDLLVSDLSQSEYQYKIPEGIEIGLYVNAVTPDSVAEKGGIIADDIIIKFNNVELKGSLELRSELNKIIVGDNTRIEVVVYRNNQYITLELVF